MGKIECRASRVIARSISKDQQRSRCNANRYSQVSIESADCGSAPCPSVDIFDSYLPHPNIEIGLQKRALREVKTSNPFGNDTGNLLHRRMANPLLETNVPDEMKVVSQPPGRALVDIPGYAYDTTAGSGSTIYIIDSGLTSSDPRGQVFDEVSQMFTRAFEVYHESSAKIGSSSPHQRMRFRTYTQNH